MDSCYQLYNGSNITPSEIREVDYLAWNDALCCHLGCFPMNYQDFRSHKIIPISSLCRNPGEEGSAELRGLNLGREA
jgi:hypothetical protein